MPALTTNCPGPVHEWEGAGYFCPLDPRLDPENWEEHCATCQARREHWEELGGDIGRDES